MSVKSAWSAAGISRWPGLHRRTVFGTPTSPPTHKKSDVRGGGGGAEETAQLRERPERSSLHPCQVLLLPPVTLVLGDPTPSSEILGLQAYRQNTYRHKINLKKKFKLGVVVDN